jgi:hypothetical protein
VSVKSSFVFHSQMISLQFHPFKIETIQIDIWPITQDQYTPS